MDATTYQDYVNILHEELVPAMGCTEPIAIAYAAAVARQTLGRPAQRMEVEASGNIIKNVKSVFVPNTGGLRGIPAAAAAGMVAGDPALELEVLSSLNPIPGTIVKEVAKMEKMLIRGVTKDKDVARISVIGLKDTPGVAFKIFSKLSQRNINVDIILQSVGRDGTKDITFTVSKDNGPLAVEILNDEVGGFQDVVCDTHVAKVSIVGAGMESHPGTASKMFEALYERDINIQMISTSEIKISVLVAEEDADKAVSAVHAKFIPND